MLGVALTNTATGDSARVNPQGQLATIPGNFYAEVQKGNVPGHSILHKFGRNPAVPNGSFAFVNTLGFTAWPLSAPTTVRVKAGDVADDVGGAGAAEITVQGIGLDFKEATEVLATNGTSASAVTATSFWRVHRAWVSSVGTYGAANTAAVTIENGAGGTDLIQIGAEEGQTQYAAWTVPAGKTAYFLSAHLMVDSGKTADLAMYMRENMDITSGNLSSKRLQFYWDGVLGHMTFKPNSPVNRMEAKTDFWFEAQGSGAQTEVSVDFELLVVDLERSRKA
jgi:hypothetical protein